MWAFFALPGFCRAGELSRSAVHPSVRSVGFLRICRLLCRTVGCHFERLPSVRIRLFACSGTGSQPMLTSGTGLLLTPCLSAWRSSSAVPRSRLRLRSACRSLSAFGSALAAVPSSFAVAHSSGLAARLARRPCPRPWLGPCGSPCSPPPAPGPPVPGPSFYFSPKYGAGFTLLPFIITSKCRCGPVAYPVMPILAIC